MLLPGSPYFNSTKVQFGDPRSESREVVDLNFNSTKVQFGAAP